MKYRYYNDIVEAKEIVREAMEKVVDERLYLTMQNCVSYPQYQRRALESFTRWFRTAETMRKRIALLTVLYTGVFSEDSQSFLMPATVDCLENYRKVRSMAKYKHKIPVGIYVRTDYTDPNSERMEIVNVRV